VSLQRIVGDDLVLEVVECRLACCLGCLSPEKNAPEKSMSIPRLAKKKDGEGEIVQTME
jgi:hypothetical protein